MAQGLSLLMAASFDSALTAPAVARNRDPILAVLREVLAAPGTVLEIASGSGEHAVHFASALPHLVWQPTDPDAQARRSIAAHAAQAALANLLPPLELDASAPVWPVTRADAVVALAAEHGLGLQHTVAMPANNLSVVFRRNP